LKKLKAAHSTTVFLGTTCAKPTGQVYFQCGGLNGNEEIFRRAEVR
jgi:hypothetical protein